MKNKNTLCVMKAVKRNTLFSLTGIIGFSMCLTLMASPEVIINDVKQRWPWNNKVDITYTVTEGQMRSAGLYCALRFQLTAGGKTYSFEGSSIGASAEGDENGKQHIVTWTAPKGIVASDCALTATLYSTNVPSGNDYMIVDLNSGDVYYEGLMERQEESNRRYNEAPDNEYKKHKIVLRKIPRTADSATLPNGPFTAGYPTGDDKNYSSTNPSKRWVTDRNYYVGLFPVTKFQYYKVRSDIGYTGDATPINKVSWNDLRGEGVDATSSIPLVEADNTGTFFQRLKYITGNTLEFDLPTLMMSEIADRAGSTSLFFWGDEFDKQYSVCKSSSFGSNGKNVIQPVGTCLPNAWGIFDATGNVFEFCRDDYNESMLKKQTNPFMPIIDNSSGCTRRGGGDYASDEASASVKYYHSSFFSAWAKESRTGAGVGFRIAVVME